eukprot:7388718-Prymnesium_polylepis.1
MAADAAPGRHAGTSRARRRGHSVAAVAVEGDARAVVYHHPVMPQPVRQRCAARLHRVERAAARIQAREREEPVRRIDVEHVMLRAVEVNERPVLAVACAGRRCAEPHLHGQRFCRPRRVEQLVECHVLRAGEVEVSAVLGAPGRACGLAELGPVVVTGLVEPLGRGDPLTRGIE